MKALLGSLLCLVLFASQCFAIKGGPVYPGRSIVTTGTYSGALIPTAVDSSGVINPKLTEEITDNSLGIFTVTVPAAGLANGTIGLFRNGYFYPGTIQGIVDPDSAFLIGVVNCTFSITFTSTTNATTGDTKDIVITFNASGEIDATVQANSLQYSTATSRLSGEGNITYATVGDAPGFDASGGNSYGAIHYVLAGFKQT